MQVKSIANAPRGAFCNTSTFIKLPFAMKIVVLSIFEWPLKTGFTVVLFFHTLVPSEYWVLVEIIKELRIRHKTRAHVLRNGSDKDFLTMKQSLEGLAICKLATL